MKVGVVGVGSLGFHHARILRTIADVRLMGVYDSEPSRLAQVAAELGITAYDALDELLDTVQACVVAVPTTAHEEVACAALSRGIHVLVEKPIAPDLAAADRMLATAQAAGALIQIGHVERFNGALRACEPYLDQPIFVESHRLAPFGPRGTDVAVVLDLMIHDLDLVLSLMRRPVTSIAAVGVPVLTTSPDIANARLEFEGGGVANLTASRVSLERMRKIRFFQRSGYISLDLAGGKGEFLRLRPGVSIEQRLAALGENRSIDMTTLMDIVERISLQSDGAEPLRVELERFMAAAQGREPVAVSGNEGRDALAVALEINRRIETYVAAAPA
jgi:predicted dehydrogenase